MQRAPRAQPTPPECALAVEMFDHFCSAGSMKQILALHREICSTLNLKPTKLPYFYPKLKFLGRQRRLKEGDGSDEKYGEIDETLSKLGQKLRDSGRPEHGTKKVASLANEFVKQDETKEQTKQEEADIQEEPAKQEVQPQAKGWRSPATAGMQCAACKTRVFAAECVTADGLHLHKACFRCAICKAVLRPGNYTMERYGSRLVCFRHSGVSVPDAVAAMTAISSGNLPKRAETAPMPERISVEVSDTGKRELDEDELTDRNFLASKTSGAGGLSGATGRGCGRAGAGLSAERCAPSHDGS